MDELGAIELLGSIREGQWVGFVPEGDSCAGAMDAITAGAGGAVRSGVFGVEGGDSNYADAEMDDGVRDDDDMGVRGVKDDMSVKRRSLSVDSKAVLLTLDVLGRYVACVARYNYPTRLARDWARIEAAPVLVVNRPPSAPPLPLDASADISSGDECESAERWSLDLAISLGEIEAAPLGTWRARLRRGLAALLRVAEARVELPVEPRVRSEGWGVVAEMRICDHDGADLDSERNAHDAAIELDRTHERFGGAPWNLTTDGEARAAAVEPDSLAATVIGAEWDLSFFARLRREMGLGGRGQRSLYLGLAACIATMAIAHLASRRFADATKSRAHLETSADVSRRPKGAHLPSSLAPTPTDYDTSHGDVESSRKAVQRRRRGYRRRALLGAGAYWLNVHFVWNSLDASHSHATTGIGESQAERFYQVGVACVGTMTIVSVAVASVIVVYGLQGTLSVRQLTLRGAAAEAERGAHSTTNALLDTALVAGEAKLVTLVALLTGMSIDAVVLLPWTDDRCDGLPQKPLLVACALTIVLAEAPMLVLKELYRQQARTGLFTLLSIVVSIVRLYRALLHRRLLHTPRASEAGSALRGAATSTARWRERIAQEAPKSTGFTPEERHGTKIAPKTGSSSRRSGSSSKRISIRSLMLDEFRSRRTSRSTSERRATTGGGSSSRLDVGTFQSSTAQRNLASTGTSDEKSLAVCNSSCI